MEAFTSKLKVLKNKSIGEFCDFYDLGTVATVHMCILDQNLQEFSIGTAKFNINSLEQQLEMRMKNIDMKFTFTFDLWTEPNWIKDHGQGTVTVSDASIILNFNP